jgi:hypothetical protein
LTEEKPSNKSLVRAIKEVAQQLGNTPAVCRKSYIHPAVFRAYLQGGLRMKLASVDSEIYPSEIWAVEQKVLRFLRAWTSGAAAQQALKVALKVRSNSRRKRSAWLQLSASKIGWMLDSISQRIIKCCENLKRVVFTSCNRSIMLGNQPFTNRHK